MNKSYKSVYNEHTNTWVAVSEISAARGKRSGSAVLVATITTLAALGASPVAQAQLAIDTGSGSGPAATAVAVNPNDLALGDGTVANGQGGVGGATAVGNNSTASAADAIAIGSNATASQQRTIAIGQNAQALAGGANGFDGIAIGTAAQTTRNDAVAIGSAAHAYGDNAIAMGKGALAGQTSNGNGPIAIGAGSTALLANSVALGLNAKAVTALSATALGSATTVSADNATAIGSGATASTVYGVALGSGSVANTAAGAAGFDPKTNATSTDTSATWKSTLGAISVGGNGNTRQITNVAAGTLNSDAVNVAQLKAGVAAATTHYYSVNDNGTQGGNYNNDGAISANSLAAGVNAQAIGISTVAVGYGAHTNGNESVSFGANAGQGNTGPYNTSIGRSSGVNSTGSSLIAVGDSAGQNVTGDFNAGFGSNAGSNTQGSFNTAIGYNAGNSTVGSGNAFVGMFAGVATQGNNNVALGMLAGTGVNHNDTVSIGLNALANAQDGDVALGANSVTAVAFGTTSATVGGVTYGGFAGTTPASTVSIGSVGNERTLTNVAAGRITSTSTDAINGSQLYAVAANLAAGQTHYFSVNDNGVHQANYNNDGATGVNALAAGTNARAINGSSVSLGNNTGTNTPFTGTFTNHANVAVGSTAGTNTSMSPLTAQEGGNVALGVNVGNTITGYNNIAIGAQGVGNNIANGWGNVAIGSSETGSNLAGNSVNNVAMGSGAGANLTGSNNVAIGAGAGVGVNAQSTVSIGGGAKASATSAIAIGDSAMASKGEATAIGFRSNASAAQATAVGNYAYASNVQAAAFGTQTTASGQQSTALGTKAQASAARATALGYGAIASQAQSIAMGYTATARGANTIAIGTGAEATLADNVALGSNSVDKAAVQVTGATVQGRTATLNADGTVTYTSGPAITYSGFAGTAVGVVSVGSVGAERQIVNVAAGEISATSTDAINGSQLFAVADSIANGLSGQITNIVNNAQTHYYSVNSTNTAAGSNYANDGATGADSMAAGVSATSAGAQSTALGYTAASNAANSVAVGSNSSVVANATGGVAIGNNASTTVAGGVAIGEGSVSSTAAGVAGYVPPSADAAQTAAIAATTSTAGAVAVGDASNGVYRQITGVAAGSADSDAVNVAQLKATVTTAVDSVALNFAGNSGDVVSVANNGTLAIKGEATTAGAYTGANMKTVTDPNTGAINIQMAENPVFTSVTTGNTTLNNNGLVINNGPSVTSAGINANNTVISNVAPGIADNDAVNVSQLKEFKGDVSNEFKSLRKEMRGGVALAAALVAVTPVEPGKSHVNLEVATHKGEYGMGVSWLKRSENGRWTLNAGAGWGSGGAGTVFRAGAGFTY